MTSFGWDASNHDWDAARGPMDLTAARADGIEFFVHKAGEGGDYDDPYFAEAMRRALAARFPLLGAYYVNHPGNEVAQAAHFVALLDGAVPGWRELSLLLMADCERWTYGTGIIPAPDLASIHRFCDELARLGDISRRRIVVYPPNWAYNNSLSGLRYKVWSSDYDQSGESRPYRQMYAGDSGAGWAAYDGAPTPTLWQYASDAVIAGHGPRDISAYRGTIDELLAELGLAGGSGTVVEIPRWSTVVIGPTGEQLARLAGLAPNAAEMWISSGMDGEADEVHGPPGSSHHYGLTYNGSPTAALDLVGNAQGAGLSAESSRRMRDFARWCYDNFADLIVELIHTTPYDDDQGFYVKNGVRYPGGGPYGDPGDPNSVAGQHASHDHLAMSAAQIAAALERMGAGAPEPPPADGGTTVDLHGYDGEVLARRVEAAVKLLPTSLVSHGSAQGEAIPLVTLLLEMRDKLNALDVKVDALGGPAPEPPPTPDADAQAAVNAVRALADALRQLTT